MVQLADPVESVVALHVWALPPVPRVKVTPLPGSAVPAEGSSVVRTPDNVTGCPFVAEVAPV
jgi:hypothetical protein